MSSGGRPSKRATATIRCSQLSRTRSVRLSRKKSTRASVSERSGCSFTPRTLATACATNVPSESGASSTNHTPSG